MGADAGRQDRALRARWFEAAVGAVAVPDEAVGLRRGTGGAKRRR